MITVCRIEDLPPGESIRVTDGVAAPVAVFHTEDGEVYAIDDTCTHQDASLADGWLEGCFVECPLHTAFFDLRTGRPTCPPAEIPGTHSPGFRARRSRPAPHQRRGAGMRSITVVGASLAGLYAARALRAQGFDGRLVIVGEEHHQPYDRPPLSKDFLTGAADQAQLALTDTERPPNSTPSGAGDHGRRPGHRRRCGAPRR